MPDVSYSRVNWADSPSTTTPINAENLNKMDKGISDCATEINSLRQYDVKKFSDSSYQTVDSIGYNPTTSELGLKVNGADTVIPFSKKNTETYPSANTDVTANGTYDMGADNNYRYVNVKVPNYDFDFALIDYNAMAGSSYNNVVSAIPYTFCYKEELYPKIDVFGYQNSQSNISLCGGKISITHSGLTHSFAITYNVACRRYLGNTSAHFSAGQSETLTNFYQYMPISTGMSTGNSWYRVIFD